MSTKPMTIRLSEEEKQEAMKKGEAHGLTTIAAVLRFALKRLKMPQ